MKILNILALVSTALALPSGVEKRQVVGATANEFKQLGCDDIIFIWARGSAEIGNMGVIVGPQVATLLKAAFPGKVRVQGVDYAAALSPNFLPGGTDAASIALMRNLINDAATQCPNSTIVTGGYSQGAAVNHRAIENLPEAQKARIVGVIMFGDTQFRKDGGKIPNFPADKTKIICAAIPARDTVCDGILTAAVLPPHLSYGANAGEGADFLIGKIRAAQ